MEELGDAVHATGSAAQARKSFGFAVDIARVMVPDDPLLTRALWKLGATTLETHAPAQAVPLLREALVLARGESTGVDARTLAAIEFDLARSLWTTRQRREATEHATAARTELTRTIASDSATAAKDAGVEAGAKSLADQLSEVEAWLATHASR